jgi:hypothetical protein
MYDPTVGRFLEDDPTEFEAGDTNTYCYVGNHGTIFIDPTGLAEVPEVPRIDFDGRIHDPIPPQVPKEWGLDNVQEALDNVEKSLKNRSQKGIENDGMDEHHDRQFKKEKNWKEQLEKRLRDLTRVMIERDMDEALQPWRDWESGKFIDQDLGALGSLFSWLVSPFRGAAPLGRHSQLPHTRPLPPPSPAVPPPPLPVPVVP